MWPRALGTISHQSSNDRLGLDVDAVVVLDIQSPQAEGTQR